MCLSGYGSKNDWLTGEPFSRMIRVMARRRADISNSPPRHFHCCDNDDASQMHFDKNCGHQAGDITEECRGCEEGYYIRMRRPAL